MKEKRNRDKIDFSFNCPSCKMGKIKMTKTIYDVSDGDKMLLIKFECDKCQFSNNDIIPLTTNNTPGKMTLKVSNEKDLKSKIYRSPIGRLEIPELELSVEPGPSADFYYTNIEGVLFRFENAVSIYRKNLENDDAEIDELDKILINLRKALKGEFEFTLILTDSEGGSYILPEDKSKYSFQKFESDEVN